MYEEGGFVRILKLSNRGNEGNEEVVSYWGEGRFIFSFMSLKLS